MAFEPNTLRPRRATRNFDVLKGGIVNPNFFMKASTSGVAGQALKYDTTENTVDIAAARTSRYMLAGFLLQDVRDLSALNGYRNWTANSVANFGDAVGVVQGPTLVMTRTYVGSPVVGDLLEVDANGYLAVSTVALNATSASGLHVGIVEAVQDGELNPGTNIEPSQGGQTTPSNRNFIRVKLF